MNIHRQADQTKKAVPRLVVLLFSLAVLAEWAATAPAPVRVAVLLILRRAEAIACSIVHWEIHDCGLTLQWAMPPERHQHYDPHAAMLLGWWFRILAVALRDLPRRAFLERCRRPRVPECGTRLVARSDRGKRPLSTRWAKPIPDT